MTDLPSVRSINNTTAPLRQAYEISIMLEVLEGEAQLPPWKLETYKRQFMRQLEQVASCLGLMLTPGPRVVVNNEDNVSGFGR